MTSLANVDFCNQFNNEKLLVQHYMTSRWLIPRQNVIRLSARKMLNVSELKEQKIGEILKAQICGEKTEKKRFKRGCYRGTEK